MKSGSAKKTFEKHDRDVVRDSRPGTFTEPAAGSNFKGSTRPPDGGDSKKAPKSTSASYGGFALKSDSRATVTRTIKHEDIAKGVEARVAVEALENGLNREDVRMVIPDRTLERRIAGGAPLKIEEADGIARLLRVVEHARRTFGDNRLADIWLRSPNPALGEQVPIRMAQTDLGGREVETILGRIEYGVFS